MLIIYGLLSLSTAATPARLSEQALTQSPSTFRSRALEVVQERMSTALPERIGQRALGPVLILVEGLEVRVALVLSGFLLLLWSQRGVLFLSLLL